MSKNKKFLIKLIQGKSDSNINFSDLCNFLVNESFKLRINGSHHIFTKDKVEEILNLQPKSDGKSKPYQVKQVRDIVLKYKLGEDSEDDE